MKAHDQHFVTKKLTDTHTNKHLTSVVVLWNIFDAVSAHQFLSIFFFICFSLSLTLFLEKCVVNVGFLECMAKGVFLDYRFFFIPFVRSFLFFMLTHHLCCCFITKKRKHIRRKDGKKEFLHGMLNCFQRPLKSLNYPIIFIFSFN